MRSLEIKLDPGSYLKVEENLKWTKDFYAKQKGLLDSAAAWSRFFPADPPGHRKRRATTVVCLADFRLVLKGTGIILSSPEPD
jgi:hypothetical protein